MNLLNADVVENILDSYDHWWPRDFCRLALVSSVWLQPVRKHLYACPDLSSYRSCHLLARTLQENRDVIPLVRGLDIRPESPSSWRHDEEGEHIRGVCPGAPRLLALVNLERLTLSGDLAFSAHHYLRMITSPQSLKSLSIVCRAPQKPLSVQKQTFAWDGELALRFHMLQTLTLDGLLLDVDDMHYDSEIASDRDASAAVRGCTLKELRLRQVDFTDNSGWLCALLGGPGSWCQLRSFTFTTQLCSWRNLNNFFSVLACVHDSLEQLSFYTRAIDLAAAAEDEFGDMRPLHRLRSLKTCYHLLLSENFFLVSANVETLEVVGVFELFHMLDWADYIRCNRFPNLRSLVVNMTESVRLRDVDNSHRVFGTLMDVCKDHGIELKFVR
ncbi:hypothetical protein A7U60_g5858 [Sanghuangporus baumii]|uniref:Uncharacterized protein n=1 Tax=Sanghuangporus baumii TaxID=108892 RepID=A0A9Q5N7Z0_SANBA|nr:hypothetical protein A7U60_g5858 [Sanghuangporus baumii]